MIPKPGKTDRASPRSWRSIALLSCIGKGLERTVARRIAWTTMTHKVLSPQHGGALPKRSAADFTHDTEAAWALGKHVTMVTLMFKAPLTLSLRTVCYTGWLSRDGLEGPYSL
jgi:hypothetical protein